jgi:hypothetical protein
MDQSRKMVLAAQIASEAHDRNKMFSAIGVIEWLDENHYLRETSGNQFWVLMTPDETNAFKWALETKFESVAARYARTLAKYIERINKNG